MFLNEYHLVPDEVDSMTGNDIYMILYQRVADTVNAMWRDFKSKSVKGNTMSKDDFFREFASKVG